MPGVHWDLCFLHLLTVNIYSLLVMDTSIYILLRMSIFLLGCCDVYVVLLLFSVGRFVNIYQLELGIYNTPFLLIF
ncbi:hypothetical protein L211DRAFT_21484 [Terfezia boudieri ATCC MYA-4762]|uniref:Uncharacterized protein n=1 Tax=Terfezia boudieri ATCC MYA-4762 TaxID=1051890 RepID=A0A3N4M2X1_9PEZI|nr:hypothetical protein L211DRAFT_21484 [Terfezia boudieri ATCC MYA-4762]